MNDELIAIAKTQAALWSIDPALVCAICEQESSWDPWSIRYEPAFFDRYIAKMATTLSPTEAHSRAISWGLMQIMGETARENGFSANMASLCDPATGIAAGIQQLKKLLIRSAGNVPIALNLWNGGSNSSYGPEVLARVDKYR